MLLQSLHCHCLQSDRRDLCLKGNILHSQLERDVIPRDGFDGIFLSITQNSIREVLQASVTLSRHSERGWQSGIQLQLLYKMKLSRSYSILGHKSPNYNAAHRKPWKKKGEFGCFVVPFVMILAGAHRPCIIHGLVSKNDSL